MYATAPSLITAYSANFTITGAPAARLYFWRPFTYVTPSNVPFPDQPIVWAIGKNGILATEYNGPVTLTLYQSTGTLSGITTVMAVDGVADFTNCSLSVDIAGSKFVDATGVNITHQTTAFIIVGGAPVYLEFTTQPSPSCPGAPLTVQPVVKVYDSVGNLADFTGSVTLSMADPNMSLTGTTTVTANNGVAVFEGVSVNSSGFPQQFIATSLGLTPAESNVFATPASPVRLLFNRDPSYTVTAGAAFPVQPIVWAVDEHNLLYACFNGLVTISIVEGTGSISGTVTLPAVNGVADFSTAQLAIGNAGLKVLNASSADLVPATVGIQVDAAAAYTFVFAVQPSELTQVNVPFARQPVVHVVDYFGNIATSFQNNVTLFINTPGSIIGTKTVQAVNGVAVYTDIAMTYQYKEHRMYATSGNLNMVSTGLFAVWAMPTRLAWGDPTGFLTTVMEPFNHQPVVWLADDMGTYPCWHVNGTVTFTLTEGAGTLYGITSVEAVNGVANFSGSGMTIDKSGYKTITATASNLSLPITLPPMSATILLRAGPAVALEFETQPASVGQKGVPFSPQPVVTIVDANHNIVEMIAPTVITLSVTNGSAALQGQVSATTSYGKATFYFANLMINTPGFYTITATTSTGLTGISSVINVFTVATKLIFHIPPSTSAVSNVPFAVQPVVWAVDNSNQLSSTFNGPVTITLTTGNGLLAGDVTVDCTNGVADFAAGEAMLRIDMAGTKTLTASAMSVSSATATVNVAAGPAVSLSFTTQLPTSWTVNNSISAVGPVITAFDAAGNIATSFQSTVTLSLTTGSGSLVGGTVTVNAVAGVADFNNAGFMFNTVGMKQLTATAESLPSVLSGYISIAAVAKKLIFQTLPSAVSPSLAAFATQPAVWAVNDDNELAIGFSGIVQLAMTSGSGNLLGNTSIVCVDGVADFGNASLSIDLAGTKTLTASSAGLVSVSTTVTITNGPSTRLSFVTQPVATVENVPLSVAPVVAVLDAAGNLVTLSSQLVTLTLSSGAGSLLGIVSVQSVNGLADFAGAGLVCTAGGLKAITAAADQQGVMTATSSSFFVAYVPYSLVFSVYPSYSTLSNTVFAQQPKVTVLNSIGEVSTAYVGNVTLSISAGTGVLSGTVTKKVTNGTADFTGAGLKIDLSGNKTLTASAPGLLSTLVNISITGRPASKLVFLTQPSPLNERNVPFNVQPVVAGVDATGNIDTAFTGNVTITFINGAGSLLGTTKVPAVNGIATFTDIAFNYQHLSLTLYATTPSGAVSNGVSDPIKIWSAPTKLYWKQYPGYSQTSMVPLWPAPLVWLSDSTEYMPCYMFNDTITLSIVSGTGSLLGTATVQAIQGVANFSGTNLMIDLSGQKYIRASSAGGLFTTQYNILVSAGPAVSLNFSQQPSPANGISQSFSRYPIVSAVDAAGNKATSFSGSVTLTLTGGSSGGSSGGSLQGTTTRTASIGDTYFPSLSVDQYGVDYQLVATATALSSATSAVFAAYAPATQLAFGVLPPSTTSAMEPLNPAPVVHSLDANGRFSGMLNYYIWMTVTAGTIYGTGGATGQVLVLAVNGVADLSGAMLRLGTIGSANLTAFSPGLSTVNAPITVTAGPASNLTFVTLPVAGSAMAPFAVAPVVKVTDIGGNQAMDFNNAVTLWLSSGSGVLSGISTVNATNGIADFSASGLTISEMGSKVIQASADGLVNTAYAGVSVCAVPSSLSFVTAPSASAVSNSAFAQQPKVHAVDDNNNIVTCFYGPVSITLSAGTGVLAGTVTVNAVAGVADFTSAGLNIDLAGSKTLTAVSGSLVSAGVSITITGRPATKIVFLTQPSELSQAGLVFATQPVLAAVDNVGNIDTSYAVDVEVRLSGYAPGLFGTGVVSPVNGVFTYTDLGYSYQTLSLQLYAIPVSGAASNGVSNPIRVWSTPSSLQWKQYPAYSQVSMTPLWPAMVLWLTDTQGTLPSFMYNGSVTVALTSGTGTLTGTGMTVEAINGVANFSDSSLAIDLAGSKTITVSSSGVTPVTYSFMVSAGAAAQIAFTTQPSPSAVSNNIWNQQPVLQVKDAGGNTVTSYSGSVTLTVDGLTGATGTLTGTKTVTFSNGVASFSGLSIDVSGVYRLTATAGAFTSQSDAFTIVAGPAASIEFRQQPGDGASMVPFGNQPYLAIRDAVGNLVSTSYTVTLSLYQGTGALSGTLSKTTVNGWANFTDISVNLIGSKQILAVVNSAGVSTVSAAFDIAAGAAARLVFVTQPTKSSPINFAFATQPVVRAEDAGGNLAIGYSGAVTMVLSTGTGALAGTVTVNAVAGFADFAGAGLKVNTAGTAKTVDATAAGLTAARSATFDITAAPLTLTFTTKPANTTSMASLSTAVTIYMNGVKQTSATSTISLAMTSGTGTLTGTTTVNAVAGVASFSGLKVNLAGTKVITATLLDVTASPYSCTFTVTVGAASKLVFATSPPNPSIVGVAFNPQPVVQVTDLGGNIVTTPQYTVAIALYSGTGTLGGTKSMKTTSGIANFVGKGMSISATGNKVLRATATGLTAGESSVFTVNAARRLMAETEAVELEVVDNGSNGTDGFLSF